MEKEIISEPTTKEAVDSPEQLAKRVGKLYELIWNRVRAGQVFYQRGWIYPGGRKVQEYGVHKQGEGKWPALKAFQDLLVEETDMIASGVSKQEIKNLSSLYQRAYERIDELGEELDKAKREDPEAYEVATLLAYRSDKVLRSWEEIDEGEIRGAVEGVREDVRQEKVDRERKDRFYGLAWKAENALDGMRAQALIAGQQEMASKNGFASVEDMWKKDLGEMGEFRKEVGEAGFHDIAGGYSDQMVRYFEEGRHIESGHG